MLPTADALSTTSNTAPNSPLAFLDDPFRSYSSAFLFLSTITLAAALIFHLIRHHYDRARNYPAVCPSCARIRKELEAARRSSVTRDGDHDGLPSGNSQWPSTDGSTTSSSGLRTADLLSLKEGNDHDGESAPSVSASSTFYTPFTTHITPIQPPNYHDVYCNAHTPTRKSFRNSGSADADADLDRVRMEHAERIRAFKWPAALQKVVVGEVQDSVIAKRRRSTLGRRS